MAAQEGSCFLCLDKRVPVIEGFAARGVVSAQTAVRTFASPAVAHTVVRRRCLGTVLLQAVALK